MTPVALDWRQVPDHIVERCKLVGYRGVLSDRLVREGHAIVNQVSDDGIQVIVSANNRWITLAARYRSITKKRRVRIPTPCESTLIIDLSHEVVRAVRSVMRAAPKPKPKPKPIPPEPTQPEPPVKRPPETLPVVRKAAPMERFELKAGVASVIPGSTSALVDIRLGATFHWQRFSVGIGASVAWHPGDKLTVWEPGGSLNLALSVYRSKLLRLRAGIEGALLHHSYIFDDDSGGKLDGRIGLLMELAVGRWLLFELLPYVRLDHLDHLFGDEVLYESQHVGVLLSASFRILRY